MYALEKSFPIQRLATIDLLPWSFGFLNRLAFLLENWTFLRSVRSLKLDTDVVYTRDARIVLACHRQASPPPIFLELHDDPRFNTLQWQALIAAVSGWVVISNGVKNMVLSHGVDPKNIHLAPDAYDEKAFAHLPTRSAARAQLGLSPTAIYLVYAGQLFPWKGIDDIAQSFCDLPVPIEVLLVGGDTSDIVRIKKLVGTTSNVRLIGRKPRHEIPVWLAAADMALVSSSSKFDIAKDYTSPLKLFEYLAAGLPVVASDVPSSREILHPSIAEFYHADSPADFIEAVQRLAARVKHDPGTLAQQARAYVQPYTWQARGAKIKLFINEQLAKKV